MEEREMRNLMKPQQAPQTFKLKHGRYKVGKMKKPFGFVILALLFSICSCQTKISSGQIAFYSTRDGHHEIYVINVDGSNLHRLTFGDANNLCPDYSPDGKQIVFQTNRNGNYEIYIMNSDGSNQRRLTSHPAGEYWPSWAKKSGK